MRVIEVRSRFRVVNGMEGQVETTFRNRPRLVDRAPGFLGMSLLRLEDDAAVFDLVSRWADRASFEAWRASPAHELIPGGLELDPGCTRLEILAPIEPAGGPEDAQAEERRLREGLVEANNALAVAHRELVQQKKTLEQAHEELRDAHWHIRRVQELLPICMRCSRVKDHRGEWGPLAEFMRRNTDFLSHGCCPACKQDLMIEWGLR